MNLNLENLHHPPVEQIAKKAPNSENCHELQCHFENRYITTFMYLGHLIPIRGVSEKYPTCVRISALVLFFVIRTVASFEVVLIWLNHTLPAVLPHLKAVLERRFWNGFQLARRITLNRLDVVEPLSVERHFQFLEHPKVAGSYVGTARRLAKLYNLVFRQKLLHKVRWMRWRVIVVKKPVTALPETRSFSSHGITQSLQKFNVIFFVDRLTS